MFCRQCGYELGEKDRFCFNCGMPVAEPAGEIKTQVPGGEEPDAGPAEGSAARGAAGGTLSSRIRKEDDDFSGFITDNSFRDEDRKIPDEDSGIESMIDLTPESFDWDVNPFPDGRPKKVEDVEFDWGIEKGEYRHRPRPVRPSFFRDEDEEEEPDAPAGEEPEIFGGSVAPGITDEGEGLSRQTAKIDKFYRSNERIEEFQKLLDSEYEKVLAGRPLDSEQFAEDIESIRKRTPDAPSRGRSGIRDPYSGMSPEDMEKTAVFNRVSGLEKVPAPRYPGGREEPAEGVERYEVMPENAGYGTEPRDDDRIFSFSTIGEGEEAPRTERSMPDVTDDEGVIPYSEDASDGTAPAEAAAAGTAGAAAGRETGDGTGARGMRSDQKKTGKGQNVLIAVIVIILILLLGYMGWKYLLPKISEARAAPQPVAAERAEYTGDLNGAIQNMIGKNYGTNIKVIKYDSRMDPPEIKGASPIESNIWYTDRSGREH